MQPKFILFIVFLMSFLYSQGQIDEDEKNFTNQLYKDYCREIDSLLPKLCAAKNSRSLQDCGQNSSRYEKVKNRNFYLWSHRSEIGDSEYWKSKKVLVDSLRSISTSISFDVSMIDHYDDLQLMKQPGGVDKYLEKQQNKRIKANEEFVLSLDGDDIDEGEGIGLNLSAALPYISHPIIRNNSLYSSANNNQAISYSTYSNMQAFAGLNLGAEFHLLRTRNINLQVFAAGTYTHNGIFSSMVGEKTETSEYYDYHGGASLYLGIPRIKVFGEFIYGGRIMLYSDATSSDYGIAGTVQQVAYYYHDLTFTRLSGGLKINFNNDDDKANFLQLKYSLEKPNYNINQSSIWGLGLEYRNFLNIKAGWFPNYIPGGKPDFKLQNPDEKPTFWYVTIGRSFTIL
jgi:hypothetical protein